MSTQRQVSGAAIGWTMFAGTLMLLAGFFGMIAGFAGILNDEVYGIVPAIGTSTTGDFYFLQLDTTTWGWVHLLVGLILLLAGFAVFRGAVWARTVGVLLAAGNMLVWFAFLPWYPVWAVIVIAMDIAIIWALTVHGRDIASDQLP